MSRALLVMVHGSPRASANNDMYKVVELVRQSNTYPIVEIGFMECNTPTIPEAIARCASRGATEIVGVPYFLHTGKHVAEDLPALLDEAIATHSGIQFTMAPFLGRAPLVTDILHQRAAAALEV